MKSILNSLFIVWILALICVVPLKNSWAQTNTVEESMLRTYALKINVEDMEQALRFYHEKIGFGIEDKTAYPQRVILRSGDRVKLILNKVKTLRKTKPEDTGISFTLQVNDLDRTIEKLKAAGVLFEGEKRKEGVGNAIYIKDPSGRRVSLMHVTIVKVEPFVEPKIYNFGYGVPDMQSSRDFYARKLGFIERSERYLPLDMPLGHADKSFGFMLHYRDWIKPVKSEYPKSIPFYTIVFETKDLTRVIERLKRNKIKIYDKNSRENGKSVVFEDPFGNISEVVETDKK